MNIYDLLPQFKVLEINKMVALHNAHNIAQVPTKVSTRPAGERKFVENGYVFYLESVDGELQLVTPSAAESRQNPFLIYTEELFDGYSDELRHYATEFDEDGEKAYVRGLALYVGDVFTTNNVNAVATGLYYLADDGSFTNDAASDGTGDTINTGTYEGPVFHGLASTLPDGDTDAVELTLVRFQ